MAIAHSFIQELLSRVDVVDIVGRYVQLKKSGANWMGLCPFHGEKSPSFSVSPTKQFYHCFGCGKSGDAIRFLVDHTGMSFIDAVHDLARQYGITVPEDDTTPQERAQLQLQRQKQDTLSGVLEKASVAYQKHLKTSSTAIDYLKGRGLSGKIAKQFGLGYAPEGWRSLAGVFPHYDDPLLVESGLVIEHEANDTENAKRYDRFRDRIMFPIRNVKGEYIGFGGRVLGDGTPKYLNSPETPVFSKGRELYGLFEARNAVRERGFALVTEGYMDVVALAQLGFANAVATLGTACTNEHVQKLFRFTDAVVFSFDGDAAGRRAASKALYAALPFATDLRSIKFLFLPPEHDPDSFIRTFGKEAFARYVSEATPLSQFLVDTARANCDLNTAEGRALLCSNAQALWMPLPEGAFKMQLLAQLSDLAQLSNREILELWNPQQKTTSQRQKEYSQRSKNPQPTGHVKTSAQRGKPNSRADHAARLLLTNSALWDTLTSEDHALLCSLPSPHGELFAWLEGELHEHGPLHWNALAAGLHYETERQLAYRLMSDPLLCTENADESRHELRELINRMLIDQLKQLETQAIEASKQDPQALQRYRDLQLRRMEIEKSQSGLII